MKNLTTISIIAAFVMVIPDIADAQQNLIQNFLNTAQAQQNRAQWKSIPRSELSCIESQLIRNGVSLSQIIQQGVAPNDRRLSAVRDFCQSNSTSKSANNKNGKGTDESAADNLSSIIPNGIYVNTKRECQDIINNNGPENTNIIFLKNKIISMWENECEIKSLKINGDSADVKATCESEGSKTNILTSINKIGNEVDFGKFGNTQKYILCENNTKTAQSSEQTNVQLNAKNSEAQNKSNNNIENKVQNSNDTNQGNKQRPVLPFNEFCDRIQKNEFVNKLVNVLEKAQASGQTLDYNIDNKDEALYKWVFDRQLELAEKSAKGDIESGRASDGIMPTINECAFRLRNTKYINAFSGSESDVKRMKEFFQTLVNSKQKNSNELDKDGNFIKNDPSSEASLNINWSEINIVGIPNTASAGNRDSNGGYYPVILYALMYPNGDRAVQNIAEQGINNLEQERLSKISEIQEMEQKKKAQISEEEAYQKENEQRISIIKSGNLDAAQKCSEVFFALSGDANKINYSLRPNTNADNQVYSFFAKLDNYQENSVLSGGNGIISTADNFQQQFGKNFAKITTIKNTKWINKNNIQIGSVIHGVAKYVSNSTLQLTNGATVQVPVYEMICIQRLP